jgi:hypothetical protein
LTEAGGKVDQLRSNIIALTRQAYDDREKYDLSMKTSDARIKELEKLVLKKALSEAQNRVAQRAIDDMNERRERPRAERKRRRRNEPE